MLIRSTDMQHTCRCVHRYLYKIMKVVGVPTFAFCWLYVLFTWSYIIYTLPLTLQRKYLIFKCFCFVLLFSSSFEVWCFVASSSSFFLLRGFEFVPDPGFLRCWLWRWCYEHWCRSIVSRREWNRQPTVEVPPHT